jgi:hypothetical protein
VGATVHHHCAAAVAGGDVMCARGGASPWWCPPHGVAVAGQQEPVRRSGVRNMQDRGQWSDIFVMRLHRASVQRRFVGQGRCGAGALASMAGCVFVGAAAGRQHPSGLVRPALNPGGLPFVFGRAVHNAWCPAMSPGSQALMCVLGRGAQGGGDVWGLQRGDAPWLPSWLHLHQRVATIVAGLRRQQ